jgi:hypothetical protein
VGSCDASNGFAKDKLSSSKALRQEIVNVNVYMLSGAVRLTAYLPEHEESFRPQSCLDVLCLWPLSSKEQPRLSAYD